MDSRQDPFHWESIQNFDPYHWLFTVAKTARIVTNSSYDAPSRPLIKELGWKTIQELIQNESETMVFKSLNGLAPQYLCNLFTKNSECSSRSLRNTETDLRLPMKKTANGQKCFSFRGAKLWNGLSAESKQASSLSLFKQLIQGWTLFF